jgi:hypothetical protein
MLDLLDLVVLCLRLMIVLIPTMVGAHLIHTLMSRNSIKLVVILISKVKSKYGCSIVRVS